MIFMNGIKVILTFALGFTAACASALNSGSGAENPLDSPRMPRTLSVNVRLANTVESISADTIAGPEFGFVKIPLADAFSISDTVKGGPQSLTTLAASSQAGTAIRLPDGGHSALDAEIDRLRNTATGLKGTVGSSSSFTGVTSASSASGAHLNATQARASWVLGLLTLHGIGVAPDLAAAVSWFERARSLGEPLANAGLAWCEIDGCKTTANPAGARRWLPGLRTVNLPRAQYFQWLIDSRLQPVQLELNSSANNPNRPEASKLASRQLLLNAAKRGDVQANLELGLASAADNQLEKALLFFKAAAPRSSIAAANADFILQRTLATPNLQVEFPAATVSPRISVEPDQITTKPGSNILIIGPEALAAPSDTLARAKRNHRGEGQSANFTEAIRLYRAAQSQGNTASSVEARKILELIFSRPGPGGQLDVAWMQQLAYVDVSGKVLSLDGAPVRAGLRREQTPLFDLLPQRWRNEAMRNLPTQTVVP